MHTGLIVDFYDDPVGSVLTEKVAHAQLPDYIKTAELLSDEARARLPDDVFALVALDRGEKLRKYACTDKGNTALSVIYFMENHHKLPEEAQKVAAANLVTACGWHELQAPLALQKIAGAKLQQLKAGWQMAGSAAKAAATKKVEAIKQLKSAVDSGIVSKSMAAGIIARKLAPAAAKTVAAGGALTGAYAIGKHRGKKQKEKSADVTGTEIMPQSVDRQEADEETAMKTAGVLRPYVDVTGKQAPVRFEKRAHSHFCLVKQGQGRFPIDDYGQVMEATQWFGEHNTSLHPSERRDYCIKLAARADHLGIQVTDQIRKYAGQEFAPDGEVKVAVCGRMQFWADDSAERDMLDGLMNKYASVPPDVFCEALRQFDEATGMDHLWDDGIYDPWYSTFGFTKEATWSWTHGNDRLTDEQLVRGVGASFDALRENFGEEMAVELQKAPQKIFDSLPLDSKRIIARMVTDST